jgi:hypothetical protein
MEVAKQLDLSKEYGIKNGFLSKRKVYLKPVIRGGAMIKDASHTGFFMWEGASKNYTLPQKKEKAELVNPFKSEEERIWFSGVMGIDLNPFKSGNNYWHSFFVKITKNPVFMMSGQEFDLSDPVDNLRVRVLKMQPEIADSWEKRFDRPECRFAIVNEDYEEEINNSEMDVMETIWVYWGEIKNSQKKMADFLSLYFMQKKQNKQVSVDMSKEMLSSEIKKIIDSDKATVHSIIKDEEKDIKFLIVNGIRAGAIKKEGIGTYYFTGQIDKYGFNEFVDHVKFLKETTDPIYMKLEAQIKNNK